MVSSADSTDTTWPLRVALEPDQQPIVVAQPGFPGTRPQRFAARQVSETLIRIDCRGEAVPALAQSWKVDRSGRQWTFLLRRNARFSDGTPVTPADVSRSFAEVSTPRPWATQDAMLVGWAGIISSRLLGDSAIALEFADASRTAPQVLAHPALVTVRHTAGSTVGSGAFRVTAATDEQVQMIAGVDEVLSLNVVAGDMRDALDAGVDLVVTRDPRTLDYADGLPEYTRLPLPWDDQYVLLTPAEDGSSQVVSDDELRLANIVRVSARLPVAGSRPWWRGLNHCTVPPANGLPAAGGQSRLAYDATDPVARSVAERVVATVPDRRIRTAAMDSAEFRRAAYRGADWGYIVRLPAQPLAPCLEAGELLALAPWLVLSPDSQIRALIEVRPHAVVRVPRVVGRVYLDWRGSMQIIPRVGEGQ